MILNYYQAIEMMAVLPALLAHTGEKNIQDTSLRSNTAEKESADEVYEMWHMPNLAMEANGADFY